MRRIYLYTAVYLLTIFSYFIFGFLNIGDTIVFTSFLISTFIYTFSSEPLPDKDLMHFPEVFKYRSDRINIYGYGMVLIFILSSILIAFNSQAKIISQSLLVLIIWPLVIYGSYRLSIIHSKTELLHSAHDFIWNELDQEVDINLIKWLLDNPNFEEVLIPIPGTFAKYNIRFLRETQNLLKKFLENSDNKISSKEVEIVKNSEL